MANNIIESPFKLAYGKLIYDGQDVGKLAELSIDDIDYYAMIPGNKGGHSIILYLYEKEEFDSESDNIPIRALKVSNIFERLNTRANKITHNLKNDRFLREIEALKECKEHKFIDIIEIYYEGYLKVKDLRDKDLYFPFYMMDYADHDLKRYMDERREELDEYGKIQLCLEISKGIKELDNLNLYHRDLKPDNILFIDGVCKIGDLGLIGYRDKDFDKVNEFIGPRGWESPEVMNKFLTEGNGHFDCHIDHQSDLFQLGLIFWFIMQGNSPIGCIRRSDFTNDNEEIFEIIKRMIWHSKEKRIKSIDEVIELLSKLIKKYES